MVKAICQEVALKKDRLNGQTVGSIYFGGGTPSVLSTSLLGRIFDTLNRHFKIAADAEITLEANPDDLDATKISALTRLPVNRFSIGIQSFFEEDLQWMNRAHTASEALSCIKRCQDAGFENLSIDLIYGYPLLSDNKWQQNIERILSLNIPHVSAYSLTVEERTALAYAIRQGKQMAPEDTQSAAQFQYLSQQLSFAGFEHYEISNYARPGRYAVHNTNYWRGVPYLGIGPSAHGFDGELRYANVANNAKYMQSLAENKLPETLETLSLHDRYNEYVMTALRTQWGIDLEYLESHFGPDLHHYALKQAEVLFKQGHLALKDNHLVLSNNGKLFADGAAAQLFI